SAPLVEGGSSVPLERPAGSGNSGHLVSGGSGHLPSSRGTKDPAKTGQEKKLHDFPTRLPVWGTVLYRIGALDSTNFAGDWNPHAKASAVTENLEEVIRQNRSHGP